MVTRINFFILVEKEQFINIILMSKKFLYRKFYIILFILYILNIEFSPVVPKLSILAGFSTEQLLLVANHDSQARQLWNG